MKKTAVYALTPQGATLGQHLADQLGGDLFVPARLADSHGGIPFDRLMEVVERHFFLYPQQIFMRVCDQPPFGTPGGCQ
jgi:cobalt-precorrin 5A hydrolase